MACQTPRFLGFEKIFFLELLDSKGQHYLNVMQGLI